MDKDILLVEDDANTRAAMRALLELEGFSVDTCEDARQALLRLQECSYDDLITDLVMPHVDGLQLIRTALSLQPTIRCTVVTGSTRSQDGNLAPCVWMRKPIEFEALLSRLRG
jgi:DNA-binding response OmpR family regulator